MIKLFHQCGHCTSWNLESYSQDDVGNGLILSPVHTPRATIEKLDLAVRRASMFDPQFYLPRSRKRKFETYNFFPEVISGGFDTIEFNRYAYDAALRCLQFQRQMDFNALIIPARHINQLVSDYIERQQAFCVSPFILAYNEMGLNGKEMYLTLALTSHMVKDEKFRINILNWVTSIPEISGIYLIPDYDHEVKPVTDSNAIAEFMEFIWLLRNASLEVIVGYANVDALLYVICDPDISVTIGSFENTRIFSLDKFIQSDEERRGPRPRIFLDGLLNWIQYEQALEIRDANEELWNSIYVETNHASRVLEAGIDPHFMQPGLYKHYFVRMNAILQELSPLGTEERYELIRQKLKAAAEHYSQIEGSRIDLEPNSGGRFVTAWQAAISGFARNHFG